MAQSDSPHRITAKNGSKKTGIDMSGRAGLQVLRRCGAEAILEQLGDVHFHAMRHAVVGVAGLFEALLSRFADDGGPEAKLEQVVERVEFLLRQFAVTALQELLTLN